MKKLLKGIVEFRKNARPEYRETFARLALGQSPDTLLIACSDSRVAPNVFASTEPGDLFVIRNVGNLVAPCGQGGGGSEGAALEFATAALGVTEIIVCGHSDCGAIRALMEARPVPPALEAWLKHGGEALARLSGGTLLKGDLPPESRVSQQNVLLQLEHLRTYPAVRDRLAAGKLSLHAWWFDIARAEVSAYEEAQGRFVPIDEEEAERILKRLGK